MRSSARWLAALLILLLAGWTGTLVAQAPEPSPQSGAAARTSDQGNPAKSADANSRAAVGVGLNGVQAHSADPQSTDSKSADPQSSDSQSDALSVKTSKVNWHLGTISVGAGYASGPYYAPYGYYPFGPYGYYPGDWVYSSFAYPLWGPYPFYPGSFAYNNGRGEVRLQADPKQAEVYIDGAYAGTADRLKSMWLDPGAYDLTVSFKDHESFRQRIYILTGKSLKITAKLGSDVTKEKL